MKDILAGVDSACKAYQAGIPVESVPMAHLREALSIVLTKLVEITETTLRHGQDSVNELKRTRDEGLQNARAEMERLKKQMMEDQKRIQLQLEDLTASNALLQHERGTLNEQNQGYRRQVSQLKDSENSMRVRARPPHPHVFQEKSSDGFFLALAWFR